MLSLKGCLPNLMCLTLLLCPLNLQHVQDVQHEQSFEVCLSSYMLCCSSRTYRSSCASELFLILCLQSFEVYLSSCTCCTSRTCRSSCGYRDLNFSFHLVRVVHLVHVVHLALTEF